MTLVGVRGRTAMMTRCGLAISLVVACLIAPGCGENKTKQRDNRARKIAWTQAGENNRDRIAEFAKQEGLPGLKELLASDSSMARMVAITGLGMLKGDREATELLIKLASGEEPEDAHWAIIALANQGAPEAKELIQKLIRAENPRVRIGACLAIKEYGDASLHPLLDTAAQDSDPSVQRAAEKAKLLIREGQVVGPQR